MSETLRAILTDPEARTLESVQLSLEQELSAGSPWFDEKVA